MKILYILVLLLFTRISFSQTITETEIFDLTFKGETDAYFLKYDKKGTNYAYVYRIKDENKEFIISPKNLSDKYDYIEPMQIIFDRYGNYYTIATDYREEYGTDNYFLIVNGEQVKNYSYIEHYSSYLNKNDEYVFIFKTGEMYRIGYYSINSGFRQSEEYESIRPAINTQLLSEQVEGELVAYDDKFFFKNKNGERVFLATRNGRTSILFGSEEIKTEYGDINEGSLTYNGDGELSYIAKKTGRFYEFAGGEMVVSGNKTYGSFDVVTLPLIFNNNEPVYIAGDSISDYKYSYYVVIGDQKQAAPGNADFGQFPAEFSGGISALRINSNGNVSYIGSSELMVKSSNISEDGNSYDDYFTKSFLIEKNMAYELGFNIGMIRHNSNGDMLYTGIADMKKKERLLMLNYGESRIIINKKNYDDIYDYGFTPSGDIFYGGQSYGDDKSNVQYETSLFIGDRLIGKYNFLVYQYYNDSSYLFTYGSGNKYAFAAAEYLDSVSYKYVVVTNEGELPFPSNNSKSEKFEYIANLIYTTNDKLFFIADTKVEPETYDVTKEVFVNNTSLGKTYSTVSAFNYDRLLNEVSFTASRDKKVFLVRVKF